MSETALHNSDKDYSVYISPGIQLVSVAEIGCADIKRIRERL